MFDNKGSVSLEASIVTPIILIIFSILILLIIYIFQFNLQVFRVHDEVLSFNETSGNALNFQILDKNYLLTYTYEKQNLTMKALQQWVDFIMDYIYKVYGIFNG